MEEALISIKEVSKKFTKDHRKSLFYGLTDMLRATLGLALQRKTLRAGEFWAVKNVTIQVKRGDILGVVGRNGSGKTTLMRIIAGIYPIDAGTLQTKGRILAMFALKSGMQAHLTGRENIYLKGYMLNLTKAEIDAQIQQLISFAEMENHIDNPLGAYSDGMRARVGFAIATCVKPDIFIIDEGFAVGDHGFKMKCFKYLREISPQTAIVFVSNSMQQTETLANRIVVMSKGEVVLESYDVKEGLDYYLKNFSSTS